MFNSFPLLLDRLGNWNPQLYRELKSRLTFSKGRWVLLANLLFQGGLVFFFSNQLPILNSNQEQYSRYCFGESISEYSQGILNCTQDLHGFLQVNWRLWGLDIFTTLSVLGIMLLLSAGVYLLISDLQKEAQQGTVNFVRLSPLSEQDFIWGKLLGVPSLLYGFLIACLPLHLITATIAGIPLWLLLGFYGVVGASAVFFFSVALWIGFNTNPKTPAIFQSQSAAIAGLLAMVLFSFSVSSLVTTSWQPVFLSWFGLLYPGKALNYLVASTFLSPGLVQYFSGNELENLRWYGMPLFRSAVLGMGFMIGNFAVGSYWIQQVLKRRFRRPQSTAWSKQQSFGVTLSFVAIANGFVFQSYNGQDYGGYTYGQDFLLMNLGSWQLSLWFFFLGLTIALLPRPHYLKEWSRYHHEAPRSHRAWEWQALHEDNSPALTAIALNLGLTALLSLPLLIFLLPNNPNFSPNYHASIVLLGFSCGLLFNLTLAALWQWGLSRWPVNRVLVALFTVITLWAVPVVVAIGTDINSPAVLWLSPMPILALDDKFFGLFFLSLFSQITLIMVSQRQFHQYVKRLGRSESHHAAQMLSQANSG